MTDHGVNSVPEAHVEWTVGAENTRAYRGVAGDVVTTWMGNHAAAALWCDGWNACRKEATR